MRLPIETIIETYQQNLYAVALNICKNPQDSEDVVQDTLLAYFSHKKDFASEAHIRAWLLRVAINKAKNKTMAFFRRNTVPFEDYVETLQFATPESSALFDAVMALPEKYRVVIHLYYYEDYAAEEIAQILKLSASNVKVRLHRGRSMLKQMEVWQDDE